MSFNLGVANHPISRLGGLSSIGVYLYEDIYYRQWITEIALAFYEGRQDEFVWLDLVRQFRNPEKQQILPLNITKEIIDEISFLYQKEPIYQVTDSKGKASKKDQELWDEIREHSRYNMFMDKLDRWTHLLGTVLVKVSFVDPEYGHLVKENEGGIVQLDMLHGGVYDIRHGASPYYITELLIGFGSHFNGFQGGGGMAGGGVAKSIPNPQNLGQSDIEHRQAVKSPSSLKSVDRIYWSPNSHKVHDDKERLDYETKNPYGIVPAVPFFNQDPAHYYFLPINEPLIYANHAINMRITDLNHISKFQSFGVPVVTGVERPTSVRQGRPVDDFNQLKGGQARSRFGGLQGITNFAAGGQFRTFDAGMGVVNDGNADANALGMSIGPDTAIAVGEKGDFKFAHPNADIKGLVETINTMADMIRINHGLRGKHTQEIPSSGFSLMMDKLGVMEDNIRRSKLFKEREEQLFQVIKKLWNTHHKKSGSKKFSEDCRLKVTYVDPEFPTDKKTTLEALIMEQKILQSGDTQALKKLYPHLSDGDIKKKVTTFRKDQKDRALHEAEIQVETGKMFQDAGLDSPAEGGKPKGDSDKKVTGAKIDNRAKHSEESSKQPGKNGDKRSKSKES